MYRGHIGDIYTLMYPQQLHPPCAVYAVFTYRTSDVARSEAMDSVSFVGGREREGRERERETERDGLRVLPMRA